MSKAIPGTGVASTLTTVKPKELLIFAFKSSTSSTLGSLAVLANVAGTLACPSAWAPWVNKAKLNVASATLKKNVLYIMIPNKWLINF